MNPLRRARAPVPSPLRDGSDGSTDQGRPNRESRGVWGVLSASIVLVLYVTFVPLHTQDGPNHRQVAALLARLVHAPSPSMVYQAHLGLARTDLLFSAGYALVGAPVGIGVKAWERTFVACFLVLLVVGYRWFLRSWAPDRRRLWVWILPMCANALFVTGMYNFLAATALTFPALVFLRRVVLDESTPALLAFVGLCWIAFLAHPFPFFVLPVAWLWLWSERRQAPGVRGWAAAAALATFLILGFAGPMLRGGGPVNPWVFKPPLELVAGLVYYDFAGFSVFHLAVAVPVLAAAAWLMWTGLRRGVLKDNALWLAMLAGYFLLPNEGHGGAHLNERFLPFVWAFLPLAVPAAGWVGSVAGRTVRAIAVTCTVLLGVGLWSGFSRVGREVDDASAVLAGLPDGARLYPMEFEPSGPSLTHSAVAHLWASYPSDRTIYSPYLFTFSNLMPVGRRHPASPTYFPATPENLAERLAAGRVCQATDPVETVDCPLAEGVAWRALLRAASYYDYWFVYAPPSGWRSALESVPGLTLVKERGRCSLWRFRDARPFRPALP